MAASYRRYLGISTSREDGVAPYSELIARDTQPNPNRGSKKLLDRFRQRASGRRVRQLSAGSPAITHDAGGRSSLDSTLDKETPAE